MSRKVLLTILAFLVLAAAGCASTSNPLVGTWEMVSNDGRWLDLADDSESAVHRNVKVLNETHFAFGHQLPDGTVMAGGGRYTYADGTYTEYIDYHFAPQLVGMVIEFHCRLDDDLWYHSADSVVDGVPIRIHEIWRRVEP